MIRLGLDGLRAWKSTVDGRIPFWKSGRHLYYALLKEVWNGLGLVSVLDTKN